MFSGSPYSLVAEMLETPGIIRKFDSAALEHWRAVFASPKRLLLTGEGSSRIFPAGNMIDQSLRNGVCWQIQSAGARQAAEYDLRDFVVIGASNSGRTRELVSLFEKLGAMGLPRYGVTAAADSRLAEVSDSCHLLSCGAGKAVAATKSVVETALVYQSILSGTEWKDQGLAADLCAEILAQDIAPEIIDGINAAPVLYFAGRDNGVAEELALKANEIARRKSVYLEGTYALHGTEEVMQATEAVILIEPFQAEIEKYRRVLKEGVGMTVIAIASFDTPFPTLRIPELVGFNGYLQLMAGWNLLVATALANGVDPDTPARARKIGNEI